jgi:hypothetical protein
VQVRPGHSIEETTSRVIAALAARPDVLESVA